MWNHAKLRNGYAKICKQKGVKISHRNVIANTLQMKTYEKKYRDGLKVPGSRSEFNDICLGLLPQSHIYALVVYCHAGPYRGDQAIILPKLDFGLYLNVIEKYKISTLILVSTAETQRPPAP